jgi:hypothetical protein
MSGWDLFDYISYRAVQVAALCGFVAVSLGWSPPSRILWMAAFYGATVAASAKAKQVPRERPAPNEAPG